MQKNVTIDAKEASDEVVKSVKDSAKTAANQAATSQANSKLSEKASNVKAILAAANVSEEVQNQVLAELGGGMDINVDDAIEQSAAAEIDTSKVKVTVNAVSYTHLDVYKRQVLPYFRP